MGPFSIWVLLPLTIGDETINWVELVGWMLSFRLRSMDMRSLLLLLLLVLDVFTSVGFDIVLSSSCMIGLTGLAVASLERMGSGLTIWSELSRRLCGHCEMGFGSVMLLLPPGVEWLVGCSICGAGLCVWLNCSWALLSICMMSTPFEWDWCAESIRIWFSDSEVLLEGAVSSEDELPVLSAVVVVVLVEDLRSESGVISWFVSGLLVFFLVCSRFDRRSLACSVNLKVNLWMSLRFERVLFWLSDDLLDNDCFDSVAVLFVYEPDTVNVYLKLRFD